MEKQQQLQKNGRQDADDEREGGRGKRKRRESESVKDSEKAEVRSKIDNMPPPPLLLLRPPPHHHNHSRAELMITHPTT